MHDDVITVKVQKADIPNPADCTCGICTLLTWGRDKSGMTIAVVAAVDGDVFIQAEGVGASTVYARPGDTLTFDGTVFSVLKAAE